MHVPVYHLTDWLPNVFVLLQLGHAALTLYLFNQARHVCFSSLWLVRACGVAWLGCCRKQVDQSAGEQGRLCGGGGTPILLSSQKSCFFGLAAPYARDDLPFPALVCNCSTLLKRLTGVRRFLSERPQRLCLLLAPLVPSIFLLP